MLLELQKLQNGLALPYFKIEMGKPQKDDMKPIEEKSRFPKFKIGGRYILSGKDCDGFDMSEREYEVVADVENVNDVVLDSIVVKQVNGESSSAIFSLTRTDCQLLGISYEPQLQLFPKSLSWEKKDVPQIEEIAKPKNKAYTPYDLSTYPLDFGDKRSIRFMMVKINGFVYRSFNNTITTPTASTFDATTYFKSGYLKIYAKKDIVSSDKENIWSLVRKGESIKFNVAKLYQDSILIELVFAKDFGLASQTKDNLIGLDPRTLEGTFDDFFDVYYQDKNYKHICGINQSVQRNLDFSKRQMLEQRLYNINHSRGYATPYLSSIHLAPKKNNYAISRYGSIFEEDDFMY